MSLDREREILDADLSALDEEALEELLGAALQARRSLKAAHDEAKDGANNIKKRIPPIRHRIQQIRAALKGTNQA